MKYYSLIAIALTLTFIVGCSNSVISKNTSVHYEQPTAKEHIAFKKIMKAVAISTQDDDKYNKMTLDTPRKKAWFKSLMYLLWDRQITRSQFIAKGLSQYPAHKYEFTFVANGFQQRS